MGFMVEYGEIVSEVVDRIATITLNRPDRLNAWTPVMEAEVRAALDAAATDDAVRAIVLTGAGRGFCAGADMAALSANASGAVRTAAPVAPRGPGDLEQRYSYLLAIPKPILAAINGPVAGIGLVLTMFCDLHFMAESAKLTTAFSRRGLVAEHGSAWMLPRLIGPMNAADLMLSGRVVDAAEAERLGLVRVLPADGFLRAVQSYAADLANLCSPCSMAIIKRQLQEGWSQRLAEAVHVAEDELARCRDTEDYREGVAHYVEKRAPAFTGR